MNITETQLVALTLRYGTTELITKLCQHCKKEMLITKAGASIGDCDECLRKYNDIARVPTHRREIIIK